MITGIISFDLADDTSIASYASLFRADSPVAVTAGFEKWVHGKKYDSLIFQKIYWLKMMKLFNGPKILDICEPDWINYDVSIREAGDQVHAITCSSQALTDLVKTYFPDKIVEHVPDRLDLKTFPLPRKSHQGKAGKAVWFGNIRNAHETLPQMLPALRETGLHLRVISNLPYSEKDGVLELNPEFICYDQSKVYGQIREADILLNPRSSRAFFRYKSYSESFIGWQLGLPVATTSEDILRLMNPKERNREVSIMQPVIEQEYYIEKSVLQYREIISRIRQRIF